MKTFAVLISVIWPFLFQEPQLTVQLIGNAGVMLTDGVTSLLIDLPYQPGAFGYMRYDPAALQPTGASCP